MIQAPVIETVSPTESNLASGGTLGKFISNIGYGGVRGSLLLTNTLVLTPLLIAKLGKEQFALLALATPFMRYGFNGVFDLGLSTAVVRFVSRESGIGNNDGIKKYFTSALFLYVAACVSVLLAYPLISPVVLRSVLGLHGPLFRAAQVTFWQLLLIYSITLLSNPFFALLMGIQKVHLSHCVGTVSLLIELIGTLSLVPFGITITHIVAVYAVGAILSTSVCIIFAYRYIPDLKLAFPIRECVIDLLHYTARWSITVSTSLLPPVFDKLILARFAGLSYVAIYEAAAKLVDIMKRATQLFLLPLFPLAGAVVPSQSETETQVLYRRFFDTNLIFNMGLYLIPATLAFVIMRVWLGSELGMPAAWTFLVLSITGFLLALVTPAALILAATGRMRLLVTTGLAALSLNIGLSPLLTKHFGFRGILIGTLVAYGGQSGLILASLQRRKAFALNGASVLQAGLVGLASAVLPGWLLVTVFHGQPGPARFVGGAAICLVSYGIGILTLRENRKLATALFAHSGKVMMAWFASKKLGHVSGI